MDRHESYLKKLRNLQVVDMYIYEGMKEAEIAESLGMSMLTVHEILASHEDAKHSLPPVNSEAHEERP